MNVLLFSQAKQQEHGILDDEMSGLVHSNNVAWCRELDDLFEHLRSQDKRPHLAILCVNDKIVMKSLVDTSGLFSDVLLVFVLPNQNEELLTLAHKLRPRFIDFLDNGTGELKSVLRKMIPSKPGLV